MDLLTRIARGFFSASLCPGFPGLRYATRFAVIGLRLMANSKSDNTEIATWTYTKPIQNPN